VDTQNPEEADPARAEAAYRPALPDLERVPGVTLLDMVADGAALVPQGPPVILVVDDDTAVSRLIVRRLRADGAACLQARTGDEGAALLATRAVDLLVTDVRLPGMSGLELLRRAKARDPLLQVILMTASSDVETAVQALRENADDYLLKPFDLDELVHSVRRAIEHRSLVLENRSYRARLEEKVRSQARRLETAYLAGIRSLVTALEAKDPQTRGHSARVTGYTLAIAELLGGVNLHALVIGAELHDIGKIGTRESVLGKPGSLTEEEIGHIREHPVIGVRILSPILNDQTVLEVVRHHHERWDGGGYPDGLVGERIPRSARIVAVADALDAMTSPRSYRRTRSWQEALTELVEERGRQFDPAVVDAALAGLRRRPAPGIDP
jgi:putative two-component system response regulator